ncbi:hypothetical protein [Paraflavitalea sp. CAU 1676]|uniref:hypothetical protein n=1 Tax=Paraflavitalea sp. CAU 1676 TaxID=3032598 RepID=UPI0023DC104F|nr:hypothetical protein [Paraflavitalea sp. CAU 1676]MDF2189737.1 hypothetical protein [Paraflavitalea sp. CAU 1676]
MEKSKLYPQAYFPTDKVEHILHKVIQAPKNEEPTTFYYLTRGDESWRFEREDEFLNEYRKEHDNSFLKRTYKQLVFKIRYARNNYTDITVVAPTSQEIDKVFDVFDKLYPQSKQSSTSTSPSIYVNVDPNSVI